MTATDNVRKPMDTSRTSRRDWIVTSLIFGGALSYCLYGAISGDLFIPAKRGPGPGVHLAGLSAWAMVGAIACFWLGLIVRMGDGNISRHVRGFIELGFLVSGIVLLIFGIRACL